MVMRAYFLGKSIKILQRYIGKIYMSLIIANKFKQTVLMHNNNDGEIF
jgi:hypothetical protein